VIGICGIKLDVRSLNFKHLNRIHCNKNKRAVVRSWLLTMECWFISGLLNFWLMK
jgi:hypothetical protein